MEWCHQQDQATKNKLRGLKNETLLPEELSAEDDKNIDAAFAEIQNHAQTFSTAQPEKVNILDSKLQTEVVNAQLKLYNAEFKSVFERIYKPGFSAKIQELENELWPQFASSGNPGITNHESEKLSDMIAYRMYYHHIHGMLSVVLGNSAPLLQFMYALGKLQNSGIDPPLVRELSKTYFDRFHESPTGLSFATHHSRDQLLKNNITANYYQPDSLFFMFS